MGLQRWKGVPAPSPGTGSALNKMRGSGPARRECGVCTQRAPRDTRVPGWAGEPVSPVLPMTPSGWGDTAEGPAPSPSPPCLWAAVCDGGAATAGRHVLALRMV